MSGHRNLWNTQHPDKKKRTVKDDLWTRITKEISPYNTRRLPREVGEFDTIISLYHCGRKTKSGQGTKELVKITWFAFATHSMLLWITSMNRMEIMMQWVFISFCDWLPFFVGLQRNNFHWMNERIVCRMLFVVHQLVSLKRIFSPKNLFRRYLRIVYSGPIKRNLPLSSDFSQKIKRKMKKLYRSKLRYVKFA